MQKFKKDKALSAIFTSFSHTHHGANALNLGLVKHSGTANSVWRVFVGKTKRGDTTNSAQRQWSSVCGRSRQSENVAVWAEDFSLSLLALFGTLNFKHFI